MAIKRLQIFQAIQSRFNTLIVGSGGYYTNVAGHVFMFRTTAFQAHELPGINLTRTINDFGSELIAPANSKHNQALSVDVEFACMQGSTSHELAEKMIADIYKAIGTDPTWGGLAQDTVPITDEVDVDEADVGGDNNVKIVGGGKVSFVVHYQTNQFQES